MHLRVSNICLYCVCIVYAVAMTNYENRSFSFQTSYFLKNSSQSLNLSKPVNFFLCEGGPSLAHSKNKFHRERVPEF